MNTICMGSIQTGTEIVNALKIGVVNDGKTDCSGIINAFLSSKENSRKTLFIPKGEYYFKDTINVDGNFASLYIEPDSVMHSDGNPCFYCVGEMSEKDIKRKIFGFYCLDADGIDSESKNTILAERIKRILKKMEYEDAKSIDSLISSLLYKYFLNEEMMISKGYGIKDAKAFLDWFDMFYDSSSKDLKK